MLDLLKKSWKFLLGIAVTILGGMLLFRKDETGKVIESSTKSGVDAIDSVLKSNTERKKKDVVATSAHEKELRKIRQVYEERKRDLNLRMRKRVESSLENGDIENATARLADFLGVKNLDDL